MDEGKGKFSSQLLEHSLVTLPVQPVQEPSTSTSRQNGRSAQHAQQIPDKQKASPEPTASTSTDTGPPAEKALHVAEKSAPGEAIRNVSTVNSSPANQALPVAGMQKQPETGPQGRRAAPLDDQVLAELAAAGVTTMGQRTPREAVVAVRTSQAPTAKAALHQRAPQSGARPCSSQYKSPAGVSC